jgi:hypothetical protein
MRVYFHLPYRDKHRRGVVRAHDGSQKVPYHLFQTTVQLVETCVNKLEIEINDEHIGNDIVIALDSTQVSK